MLKKGTKIKLYPFYLKKDDPSATIEFKEGFNSKGGKYRIFQAIDMNKVGEKREGSFLKVKIDTDLPLSAGDEVVIEEIKSVSVNRYGTSVTVTIGGYSDGVEPPKEGEFNPYV